ncbi:cilia- and flagella-associated protein 251-like [Argiope bruennichi]|uniref:cilia- and flagella-associated protein 251-like n=1 Tax=Argiope bruennichi TaxID=94029 RepID=UPI002495942A|nr:cilia- and flagella-associated protein 251-like [Argiope bruennichi]
MNKNIFKHIDLHNENHDTKLNDLQNKDMELFPFKLHWIFGYNTNVPIINTSSATVKGIFFAAGSIGVWYDWIENRQHMFSGHVNDISSVAITKDKTYIATADYGMENSLIIWNARNGNIAFIVSGYFPNEGVAWMCFSEDGNILLTLSGGIPQELSLWKWKLLEMAPYCTYTFKDNDQFQHYTTFHSKDSSHFTSCSKKDVHFFKVDESGIVSSALNLGSLYDEKACKQAGNFTETIFSSLSSLAFTGTTKGKIVLWSCPLYSKDKTVNLNITKLTLDPKQRICLRMMQIFAPHCSITFLATCGDLIVAGTSESKVCFFDENFVLQWSIEIGRGSIVSVSFNFKPRFTFKQAVLKALGKELEKESPLERNDFIVCTSMGYAGYVNISSSEKRDILFGTSYPIRSVTVHPSRAYMYIGDYNGGLQKWDYNTKTLMRKDIFQESDAQIECLSIDNNGTYVACGLLNGKVVIFDAVSFAAKPCFTADIGHRLTTVKFSPDPQHLIVTDEASYVSRYHLHLIVPPEVYQMLGKDKAPPEEPVWYYNGRSHQHRGKIVDCIFNNPSKSGNLYFFTLGEDHFIIQYNITNSKNMEIEVSQRMNLNISCVPLCMCFYPLYGLSTCIAIIADDGKLRIYNFQDEKMIKMISIPLYEEPLKRIMLLEYPAHSADSIEEKEATNLEQYFIFCTTHSIGLAKYPLDGNPYGSLALASHPCGVNAIIANQQQTFLFTTGLKDSWIYMYEINHMALLKSEQKGGKGLDAFKTLFPINEDPDEMKKLLILSVYSLESEIKMLKLGSDKEFLLKGEIPINCLEYVLSALGCFLSSDEFQLMLNDIDFANKYLHNGKKETLDCLEIMKLYVNYRPKESLTKEKITHAFKELISSEEDPDKVIKPHFISILESGGDPLLESELITIVQTLKDTEDVVPSVDENAKVESFIHTSEPESANKDAPDDLVIPDIITEEIFFQDILCMEKAKEDLSSYILKRDDFKLKEKPPKLEDFLAVIEENNMWEDMESS